MGYFSHITSTYKRVSPRLLPKMVCLEYKTDLHLKKKKTSQTTLTVLPIFSSLTSHLSFPDKI